MALPDSGMCVNLASVQRFTWFSAPIFPRVSASMVLLGSTSLLGLTGCLSSGGGSGSSDAPGGSSNDTASPEACYSCAEEKCPDEAAACDESSACVTFRECTFDCAADDVTCRADCSTAASADPDGFVRGGALLACASASCTRQCVANPSGVDGSGASPGAGSSPSNGPSTPGNGQGLCEQLNDWATACNLSTEGQLPDCGVWGATEECIASCVIAGSCADFESATAGTQNQLTTCMLACVSGMSPPSSAPPEAVTEGYSVAEGGYVTSGQWQGFAWTGTDGDSDSRISPDDFSGARAGAALCASGTVAGTADYSAVAMVGINLNQSNADVDSVLGTWTPPASSRGVAYQIYNRGASTLRLQLQAPGGDTNANARFCYEVAQGQGTATWSRFNTACWDDSGTSYDGRTPLEAIMVLVPGGTSAVDYDFCIESLELIDP